MCGKSATTIARFFFFFFFFLASVFFCPILPSSAMVYGVWCPQGTLFLSSVRAALLGLEWRELRTMGDRIR